MFRHIIFSTVLLSTLLTQWGIAGGGTLEPGRCYTWGINNRVELDIPVGHIITEAELRFHHFRSDIVDTTTIVVAEPSRSLFRSGSTTTTTTIVETPNFDSLHIYVLDNPRFGLTYFNESMYSDPFEGYGGKINGVYQQGDLVYRLGSTHDTSCHFTQAFGSAREFNLADGASVSLSSSVLELIDYAGTGVSFGFGLRPGEVGYYYDDITLTLTVQAYQGSPSALTRVYHIPVTAEPVAGSDFIETVQAEYTLSVSSAHGVVSQSPDKAVYEDGETVTLTAVADPGYTFAGWSGAVVSTSSSVTLTMDADKSVTAHYTEIPVIETFALSVSSAHGVVSQSPDKAEYEDGETVTLTAIANPGYTFAGWSGAVVSTSSSVTLTMDADKSVTAHYIETAVIETYTLSITADNGSVTKTVDGVQTTASSFAEGTVVALTATANSGYNFTGWSGSASGTNHTVWITIDGNKAVTANFTAVVAPSRSLFR